MSFLGCPIHRSELDLGLLPLQNGNMGDTKPLGKLLKRHLEMSADKLDFIPGEA